MFRSINNKVYLLPIKFLPNLWWRRQSDTVHPPIHQNHPCNKHFVIEHSSAKLDSNFPDFWCENDATATGQNYSNMSNFQLLRYCYNQYRADKSSIIPRSPR